MLRLVDEEGWTSQSTDGLTVEMNYVGATQDIQVTSDEHDVYFIAPGKLFNFTIE